LDIFASELLADARNPLTEQDSIPLLVDEVIGVEAKPSSETDPILALFQELQTKIRDLEERDRKRDKEVKNLHQKLLGLRDENTELRRRLDGIESWQQTYSEEIAYDKRKIATLEEHQNTTKPQPKQKGRGDILIALLANTAHGKMPQSEAIKKMGMSKTRFSELLATVKDYVEVRPYHKNKRRNILVLRDYNKKC